MKSVRDALIVIVLGLLALAVIDVVVIIHLNNQAEAPKTYDALIPDDPESGDDVPQPNTKARI